MRPDRWDYEAPEYTEPDWIYMLACCVALVGLICLFAVSL